MQIGKNLYLNKNMIDKIVEELDLHDKSSNSKFCLHKNIVILILKLYRYIDEYGNCLNTHTGENLNKRAKSTYQL